MKTELTGKSLINGIPTTPGGESFRGINPANNEALDPVYTGIVPADVDAITRQAGEAFAEYSRRSGAERATFLRAIADNIEAAGDDIAARMPVETGLPEGRARGETARTVGQLRMFAGLIEEGSWVDARIDTAQPDRQPLPRPDVRSVLQPLGPVVVFCASNFPLAFSVAGGDTASALAAGCPVIVKAHHSHPGTAEIVGQCVQAAAKSCGMPAGTFSLVYGSGREIGTALVRDPRIKAVGFTGSRAGGTALMKIAAERPEPIPVYAEMSSINPVVILPEKLAADGGSIAQGLAGSVTLGMGQFCTNPGLVLLPAGEAADRFATTLKEALAASPSGCLLNSGITEAYRQALQSRSALQADGFEILHAQSGEGCQVGAALYRATAAAFLSHPVLSEEAFGPSTLLVTYTEEEELLAMIRSQEGQLTGTIHGTEGDLEAHQAVAAALQEKVGRLIYGGFPTGVEVCHAMVHGGPFPSTSDGRSTSVGTMAIHRFTRAVCYQNAPQAYLPDALKDGNPLGLLRLVDGAHRKD
jgi:alpha-ketoglutaric semialdehyde dehydrogenase